MAELDLSQQIRDLRTTLSSVREVLNPAKLRGEIDELKARAGDPNLWDDQANAQAVTSALSQKQSVLDRLNDTIARVDDLEVLVQMANDEDDATSRNATQAGIAPSAACADASRVPGASRVREIARVRNGGELKGGVTDGVAATRTAGA
jgi:transposase